MNPDDQNQGGQGSTDPGSTPADQGEQPVSAPASETCVTCGGTSANGNCTNCGAPNTNCTCPPTQGSGGGMGGPAPNEPAGGGPTAPVM